MRKTCLVVILATLAIIAGCKKAEIDPPPLWEQTNLSELKPSGQLENPVLQQIAGINLDIYMYEVPVDQIKTLLPVWNPLSKQGIRFKNAMSFQANGFQFSRARVEKLSWIVGSLEQAQALSMGTHSVILAEDYDSDLLVTALPGRHTISFIDLKGATQSAVVGPGQLNLRLKAQKGRGSPYPNEIVGYPMVTVPSHKGIEKLDHLASQYEAAFLSSSILARVMPGDVFLLGPEEFYGDISTLGGLFFQNPRGRVFEPTRVGGEREAKPTFKVYIILCTSIQ